MKDKNKTEAVSVVRYGQEDPQDVIAKISKTTDECSLYIVDFPEQERTCVVMRNDRYSRLSEETMDVLRELCHGMGIVFEEDYRSLDFRRICLSMDMVKRVPDGTTMKAYEEAVKKGFEIVFFVR